MAWTVAQGTDNGDPVVILIDEEYRDTANRTGRSTRLSIRVLGNYMLKSAENRTKFEDSLQPFLDAFNGAIVAGITRSDSYTFHAYCKADKLAPEDVPIEERLRPLCTVSIYDDPEWTLYDSWLPPKMTALGKMIGLLRLLRLALFSRSNRRS